MPPMLKKSLIVLSLVAACCAAQAQSSPAKKDLVNRILKVQQAGIEALARNLVEDPARGLVVRADQYMSQRVAADKHPAMAKEIDADVKKYLDEAVPFAKDRAVKLAPSTVGALLEEKFSEDELKQVLAFLESPVYVKFQQLGPDMQKALVDKLVTDVKPTIEPKVRTLEQSMAKHLGVPPQGAASSPAVPAARQPARPASR